MEIIFDLGGVVISWEPTKLIASIFNGTTLRETILNEVFLHHDWRELDRGTLDYQTVLERSIKRTGVEPAQMQRLFDSVPPILVPMQATVDLLYKLKSKGFNLYCLSNINFPILERIKPLYTFWEVFTGCVFSCDVKMIKPEPGIYRYVLETYHLQAQECLFIDDLAVNTEAAAQFGIHTIQFKNAQDCEQQIHQITGC